MARYTIILFLFFINFVQLKAQEKPCPCCTEQHRQFDFWLGNWETVKPGTDSILGTNRIVILQDSCIIQENWVSARSPYTGTSYNFYDAQSGHWYQTWIDNQGGSLRLKGNLKGKSMVLKSDPLPTQEGGKMINKISWTPQDNGDVQQLWELSTDEGKNWNIIFNGMYRKKAD